MVGSRFPLKVFSFFRNVQRYLNLKKEKTGKEKENIGKKGVIRKKREIEFGCERREKKETFKTI